MSENQVLEQDFNIFVPLDEQSFEVVSNNDRSDKGHGNYIRGWATTSHKDREGDIILPGSLDIDSFLKWGYINYEHKQGDEFKIGVPTNKTYIDPNKGLYVEAKLDMDNPYAKDMWELANDLAKSGNGRKVGFSVEGTFLGRDYKDPSKIKRVKVKNVAVTTNPANPEATWDTLVKSFTTGNDIVSDDATGGEVLRKQALAHSIRSLCYNIKDMTPDEWHDVAKALDKEDRWDDNIATVFLQLSKGLSRDDALKSIK